MMDYYSFAGGIGPGWILMLLFWGAVIWLIVWLTSQNRQQKVKR